MQNSVSAFFSWKFKENKDSKFDNNFNISNMNDMNQTLKVLQDISSFLWIWNYYHFEKISKE